MAGSRLLSPLGPLMGGGGGAAVPTAPPVISGTLTLSGFEGRAIASYRIRASNRPTDFAESGLPPSLMLDTVRGIITGIPDPGTLGTHSVTLTADNVVGTSAPATLTINIAAAIRITSSLTASGIQGRAFSYQITVLPAGGATFSATGLPAGLTISATTGRISGTLAAGTIGTHPIQISAANAGGTDTQTLTLAVTAAPAAGAPVITSKLTAYGTEDGFSYQITATNAPDSFDATPLPAGLAVDTAGLITGTPPIPSVGSPFSVTISATNSAGTGSATLVISIVDTSAVVHISGSGSPPAGPHEFGQMWVRDNTNSLAYWSPYTSSWLQVRGSPS